LKESIFFFFQEWGIFDNKLGIFGSCFEKKNKSTLGGSAVEGVKSPLFNSFYLASFP
jgi:hypothetical protein